MHQTDALKDILSSDILRNEKQNVIADSGYQKINQEASDRIQG